MNLNHISKKFVRCLLNTGSLRWYSYGYLMIIFKTDGPLLQKAGLKSFTCSCIKAHLSNFQSQEVHKNFSESQLTEIIFTKILTPTL